MHLAICLQPSQISFSSLEWVTSFFLLGRFFNEVKQITDLARKLSDNNEKLTLRDYVRYITLSMVFPYFLPYLVFFIPSFLPFFLPFLLASFLPFFLPFLLASFLPFFLPFLLASLLPCFLPSLLPSFLPSFLPSYTYLSICLLNRLFGYLFYLFWLFIFSVVLFLSTFKIVGWLIGWLASYECFAKGSAMLRNLKSVKNMSSFEEIRRSLVRCKSHMGL